MMGLSIEGLFYILYLTFGLIFILKIYKCCNAVIQACNTITAYLENQQSISEQDEINQEPQSNGEEP
ncbi:MAG: hypothetical protein OXI43_01300 [Candidatus Poribacteria bacterium]|nr:hypothetical protein [Candidatus Poribacteria bacterium]